jgi:K+-transporting ATPase ATPase C chain
MKTLIRPAVTLFVTLTVLTGVVYPLAVTGIGQLLFPHTANGSIVTVKGKPVGSSLIGQQFSSPEHFWGRPSATGPQPYNAGSSSGSNLGPLNPALTDAVKARIEALKAADPGNDKPVPVDLVTASGSGLDPEISLAAARYQVTRVAKARNLPAEKIQALIEQHAERPFLRIFGEPRVNVLKLNLALNASSTDVKQTP